MSFWQRRVVAPVVAQLKQGTSAREVALTLAVGGVLGICPLLGTTTALCALAGVWLRLNQPLIQLVNYVVYPAQLALLIPFCRAGEWLFGAERVPLLNVPALVTRFQMDAGAFVVDYGRVLLYGTAAWMIVAPLLVALSYALLKPALAGLARRRVRQLPAG